MRNRIIGVMAALSLPAAPVLAFAPAPTIFVSGTESPIPNSELPDQRTVAMVLEALDPDERELLDTCVEENGLPPKDYAPLLRSIPIHGPGSALLHFVRPASEPYCLGLYGAHLYRYFLIGPAGSSNEQKVLFDAGGDVFAVLRHATSGLSDIEATSCTANMCWVARYAFNGRIYQRFWCGRATFVDGTQRTVRTKCW